jgi:hypothetical protein
VRAKAKANNMNNDFFAFKWCHFVKEFFYFQIYRTFNTWMSNGFNIDLISILLLISSTSN